MRRGRRGDPVGRSIAQRDCFSASWRIAMTGIEMGKHGFVYILTNQRNTVLYTGVTSDLQKRIWEHKNKVVKGFTQKYNAHKLVYYEAFETIAAAIVREKQLKAGSRKKKVDLIVKMNPEWKEITFA